MNIILIMLTFSSDHTRCPPTAEEALFILYSLSSYCTTSSHTALCDPPGTAWLFSSHCRCDIPDTEDFLLTPHTLSSYCRCSPSDIVYSLITLHNFLLTLHNFLLVLHIFSLHAADVIFLILQTFSNNNTPCFPAANVALLIQYTFSSHCTTLTSYYRCHPPGTAHFLFAYCRCDIPDTADFLLQQHTLLSCCKCSPSDTVHFLLTLHNLNLVLQKRPSWYCTLSLLVLHMSHS